MGIIHVPIIKGLTRFDPSRIKCRAATSDDRLVGPGITVAIDTSRVGRKSGTNPTYIGARTLVAEEPCLRS